MSIEEPPTGSAPPPRDRGQRAQAKMQMAKASAVGLQFAISITIGALGGNWLDKRLDTEPWLLLTGIILGSAAAFRDLLRYAKTQEQASSGQSAPPPPEESDE